MTEPTTHLVEFPDRALRHAPGFEFADYKHLSGLWTTWDDAARRRLVDLVRDTAPTDLRAAVEQLLTGPAPTPVSEATPPQQEAQVDAGGSDVDPGSEAGDEQASDPDEEPEELDDDPPGPDGPASPAFDLDDALRTAETAKAAAASHPLQIGAMLEAEAGEGGRGRKSVLAALRAAAKASTSEA